MHLLHVETRVLEEFIGQSVPAYAILSHTWEAEEVLFEDIQCLDLARSKKGYKKIDYTCEQAKLDGLLYAWVDTCCIDKSSSAELSEAINSMYRWYQEAEVCYAYLSDVHSKCSLLEDLTFPLRADLNRVGLRMLKASPSSFGNFASSRWFSRGWTLQELIAPRSVLFYNSAWGYLGSKATLSNTLAAVTSIDTRILKHPSSVHEVSIAKRMSWASHRLTTRIEDRAYSLMGLFDVNMPLLYGEGKKAFTRLQEEIMKISTDHSILIWQSSIYQSSMTAESPANFSTCGNVVTTGKTFRATQFQLMNGGLRINLPLVRNEQTREGEHFAVLACRRESDPTTHLALRISERWRAEGDIWCSVTPFEGDRLAYVKHPQHQDADEETITLIRPSRPPQLPPYTLDLGLTYRGRKVLPATANVPFSLVDAYPKGLWNLEKRQIDLPRSGQTVIAGCMLSATDTTGSWKFVMVFEYPDLDCVDPYNSFPIVLGIVPSDGDKLAATCESFRYRRSISRPDLSDSQSRIHRPFEDAPWYVRAYFPAKARRGGRSCA